MDPVANLAEQRTLARSIIAARDAGRAVDEADVDRLAELVLALDEWRVGLGFDPWETTR